MELQVGNVADGRQQMSNRRSTPCMSVGRASFAVVLTCKMGDFTYAEKVDIHYMYWRANGNLRATLRMYHTQFPDHQMPDLSET